MNQDFREVRTAMIVDALSRLAQRIGDPEYDPRHAVLDVSSDLLALEKEAASLPPHLRAEFRDLLDEVRDVQPQFPSRRTTSPLFDRAGLGRPGVERAERLIRRFISLTKAVRKTVSTIDGEGSASSP